ncbi:Phytochrome-like protein cph2 [Marinomonas aquimarina]|uniref:cyclic-guanylate-specific phosphodiesterase n=1 Tax=Marinomonas aquimarina TaxID=295068 RepID=A0A1A8TQ01_9GAMM|nr:ammonium transporter [Marinomonas aquimarina]SBS36021.1 Phytochrome-like protein cph2 [Marinomonas aquimarina]
MIDVVWLLLSATLVFMMQAGFLCLESGRIRSKNSINVAAKNISDFILSSAVFNLVGFGLMFGASYQGMLGTSEFLFGDQASSTSIAFFLFQMMFCGTAATLVSGAVAERMTFVGYLLMTIMLSALIYPIVGHWAWNGVYQSDSQGWLEALGFVDFAGSTIVHSVGGWVALVAVWLIGPRLRRFEQGILLPQGSNLPLSGLGLLLIWLGWIGFNGGSTLSFNNSVPAILLNTFVSAIWGGIGASLLFYALHRYINVSQVLNGVIAGLVGITAGCHVVSASASILIGLLSGMITIVGSLLMERWRLDDALDVVPAHLFAGIWGTLAVALFGDLNALGTGLSRWQQLQVQLLGIVAIGAYCLLVVYIALSILRQFVALRVTREQEEQGLNIAEHRATTELIDLLTSMHYQEDQADFSKHVPEEPFTEVGQIAKQYNQVIDRVHKEISERDQALYWFKESEMRKSAILDSSMDCIVTINGSGHIIEYNPAAERTFGVLKRQVKGKSFIATFVPQADRESILTSLATGFSSSGGWLINRRNHFQLQRGDNEPFPVEIAITKVVNDQGGFQEFTLHIRDMTRHVKLQQRLRFLAYSDPLTSLYNRTYMTEQLEHALQQAKECHQAVALLFLDLDKFKIINDTLGHKAGDELLCEVSSRLTDVVLESDIIARWGGDEFLIMLTEEVSVQRAEQLSQKILQQMREPVLLAGNPVKVGTSIGIAMTEHLYDVEQLIQQADMAMYWAKQNGRDNAKFFEAFMANEVSSRFQYEQQIKQALAQQQFHLLYQPQIDTLSQSVMGFEALIRWQHPDKGMISPVEFIPIAEESNLICHIGDWVLQQSIALLSAWQTAGVAVLPIAVNISGRQFVAEGFIDTIASLLQQHQVDGSLLKIEITEGVFLHDMSQCIDIMAALKGMGVEISVDDFGTGYSSLHYLKELPLDILKIDKSFVSGIGDQAEGDKICEAIIQLAQNLDLKVIAEGVETQEQANVLNVLGCHLHQGYFYDRPLSESAALRLLQQGQRTALGTSVV